MKFKEFLQILESYEVNDDFNTFLDLLSDYMDLAEKSVLGKIMDFAKKHGYITTKKKVYRVMHVNDDKNIDFGRFPMISTSTSKIKGKTLDGVIGDMVDRYKYHRKLDNVSVKYVEISNVQGIDIEAIGKFVITNKNDFNAYYVDMFKRLKAEKEFLIINKDLHVTKVEDL